jgi:hypothetical protein
MHFGVAMAACLMAYNGWSYVSFVAGDTPITNSVFGGFSRRVRFTLA